MGDVEKFVKKALTRYNFSQEMEPEKFLSIVFFLCNYLTYTVTYDCLQSAETNRVYCKIYLRGCRVDLQATVSCCVQKVNVTPSTEGGFNLILQ